MHLVRVLVPAVLALVAVAALLQLTWGYLDIPALDDVPPIPPDDPRAALVSVIVAARDEERHIETAVRSLLAQTYRHIELIVVDDRSTDATPRVLAGLAKEHRNVRALRVDSLPDGWLGKNHALHTGARSAGGDVLLFVDGDVVLAPETVARAMRLLALERADHVAVSPDVVAPTAPLALVVNYFFMWFMLYLRPWRARDPNSRGFIGIGAFNLVRRSAYESVGGHSRIALRPDDDLMLGKLLKTSGHRQILATGEHHVSVEWYRSLGELARGFRKNAFAGLHYSLLLSFVAFVGQLVFGVWPFIAIWMTSGAERGLYAVAAVAQMIAYAGGAFAARTRPWLVVFYPIAAVLFTGIVAAAVGRTVAAGAIEWRGTRYPLDALRANRV